MSRSKILVDVHNLKIARTVAVTTVKAAHLLIIVISK